MNDLEYRVGNVTIRDEHRWGTPHHLPVSMSTLEEKATKAGGPYKCHDANLDWPSQDPMELESALTRIKNRVEGSEGLKMFLRCHGAVYGIRCVDITPPVDPPTVGTPAIKEVYVATMTEFPGIESWGICNCRYIAGTHTWSQHAWCNGWDIHAEVKQMDDIYAWQQSQMKQHKLPLAQVLYRVPDHYDHLHDSGDPLRTGTPPCAG